MDKDDDKDDDEEVVNVVVVVDRSKKELLVIYISNLGESLSRFVPTNLFHVFLFASMSYFSLRAKELLPDYFIRNYATAGILPRYILTKYFAGILPRIFFCINNFFLLLQNKYKKNHPPEIYLQTSL